MTTPDAELNKALWLDKTAFWHLKKTEQDVDKLRAALPKEVKDSLILWDRAGAVTADLIYAITVHLNKEKEAGRSWPSRATRDQARECIKAAKELLHNINLAQTVASTVETVDAHGVRIDGLEEHVVEQKTFKEEQEKTNRWLQKEVDACVDGHKTTQLDVNDQRRAMDKVKHFVEGAIGQQSRMAETSGRRRSARSFPISPSPTRKFGMNTPGHQSYILAHDPPTTASAKHPSGRNRIPD